MTEYDPSLWLFAICPKCKVQNVRQKGLQNSKQQKCWSCRDLFVWIENQVNA